MLILGFLILRVTLIKNHRFWQPIFTESFMKHDLFFQEHVKTHSEEYKFNCKFCNASFINRNVMVTHQRTCPFSTDETNGNYGEFKVS